MKITHPDRVLYSSIGLTKFALAKYYESMGEYILPHLEDRPLTLVRCPTGVAEECFFMKHSKVWAPAPLRRVRIQEKTKLGEYLVADNLAAVIGLVQMDVLEIHTWNSTMSHLEQPDRVVFDLDPGPEIEWREVIDAARLVRSLLERIGLKSFVKTTGGAGLHVVVPLQPDAGWDQCLAFSRAFAEWMTRHDPSRFTASFAKKGRARKILVDYLRNNRTNTSIAAYSTRAKPLAPVSMPLAWDELSAKRTSSHYTVANALDRMSRLKRDPWNDYWSTAQRIPADAASALNAP